MEENRENPIRNSQKIERNPDGTLKKGVVLNPNGRPKGSEDFKTKFYKVVDKLAKQNNITPEEVEEQILLVGYKRAKDGDYSFYRDLMDRIHGRPVNKNEITGADGKDLIITWQHENNNPLHTENTDAGVSQL